MGINVAIKDVEVKYSTDGTRYTLGIHLTVNDRPLTGGWVLGDNDNLFFTTLVPEQRKYIPQFFESITHEYIKELVRLITEESKNDN